ncbi:unnamed protein product [Phaedon cochleariae]|uniref:Uncharacterized protein n=1 Tax=Phaedon cochleariae TaxID=80249 RepID=A0A9N9SBT3_PHACE|nr:unnamed protein product [Phaedon cochleariae]
MSSLSYRHPPQSHFQQPGIAAPAPAMSQRFCLRWNNHQSNLLSVFDQLLHDESFVDVTLAVEGQLLKAHKMVLSACSPYFQALFINHPDKHPIVILKDVPYIDMKCLLDFMYRGEVSVDQDRLTAFLRVAESLRIKGLTEVNEEKCDTIASSLTQQNLHNLPHLQRLQQNKRYGHNLNMLSNALLQPKRKRGRPRKLSGCSNGPDDFDKDIVQGSPEMLEVKMGMDNFNENSNGSVGKLDIDEKEIKEEQEPMAGTSNEESMQQHQQPMYKNSEEFQSSDSPITQKLLTVKSELFDRTIKSEQFESTDHSSPNTPESSRISTPDNLNNNNMTTTPSTSSMLLPNMLPNMTNPTAMGAPAGKQPPKKRVRRRAISHSLDPAEHLTEMSVRGLNLFRYASITDGIYQCTECAKVDVQKTFKNKYSFQRHAFLYHEGHQRKVFPCPVCQKEFSRPDKMKNHMKTVHDCFMPKDVVFPAMFFPTL